MNITDNFADFAHDHIKSQNLEPLKAEMQGMTPAELLYGLQDCEEHDRAVVFRLLDKNVAIDVFEMMDPVMQKDLVVSFTKEETLQLLTELDPDDQVRFLDELPAKVAKRLMEGLPREQRQAASQLMGYADGTVGRIMSPVHFQVTKAMTVEEALNRLRMKKKEIDFPVTMLYVTDETRHIEGMIPVSRLVVADPATEISQLLGSYDLDVLNTSDDQEDAARFLQRADAFELPVVDRENRLVGVLTADDAMDVIREETTDDMYDKVGLIDITKRESDRSHNMINGSFGHVLRVRLPFLLITLAGGMLAGAVIGVFEELLEAVAATAIFIPVIMDMGGNVGTQSSTIFTRGLVLGQISMGNFFRQWLKELRNGVGMGIALGICGGIIAGLWMGIPALGVAVGISLALTISIAVGLGFIVPWILVKLGFDQAAGADPIITTIKDVSGLMIYFTAVTIFLPQVL
ncbi:magnesium transporter [Alkalispirochaeta americana]|uniref:Magnesium transporter MgtE n=1 Tax=Alkalispirochaeta americana TaxID=159291 RepID=A0A1N6T2F2_9SPIO|nr:magnesium transporter [Alkalispirochaeta americana]SIQ47513.1 magnesium transporter [Alkalispirochaeta americana]